MLRRILGGVVALLVVAGCSSMDKSDDVLQRQSAISGGDATDVTFSQNMPERAVVHLSVGCSGTAIQRDIILTASHCFCNVSPPSPVTVSLPLVGNPNFSVDGTYVAFFKENDICDDNPEPADAAGDLAIVQLSRSLTTAELPNVVPVYTKSGFYDQFDCGFQIPLGCHSKDPAFFALPAEMTGWAAFPIERKATIPQGIGLTDLVVDNPLPFVTADGLWILADFGELFGPDDSHLDHGDSGGPMTFRPNGGPPTIIGVASLGNSGFTGQFSAWAPTWNNGLVIDGIGPGDFVNIFVQDADGDGQNDNRDNCHPQLCTSGQFADCANPNQVDTDGDGLGDACDNCPTKFNPPHACQQGSDCVSGACVLGGPKFGSCSDGHICSATIPCATGACTGIGSFSACVAGQPDLDGDGVGDVCDLCPVDKGVREQPDNDKDLVGDSCDNCPTAFNPPRACTQPTDCPGSNPVCVVDGPRFGKCSDGTACTGLCTVGSCTGIGTFSACARQTDTDGDGLGDACDSCPFVTNGQVQANSNPVAEGREVPAAAALGDACDQVPVFTSRPVMGPVGTFDAIQTTMFTSYAGVGSATSTTTHLPFVGAPVGFRQCSCFDKNNPSTVPPAEMNTCFQLNCPKSRDEFTKVGSSWKIITTGAGAVGTAVDTTLPPATQDLGLDPTYTGGIDCTDVLPHPELPGQNELCRIGTPRPLFWFQGMDATSVPPRVQSILVPRIPGLPGLDPMLSTTGIFWSHGSIANPPAFADLARDQALAGRLRDHYTYLVTPVVPAAVGPIIPPAINLSGCANSPQCVVTLRPDLIRVNPPGYRNIITALEAVRRPAVLNLSAGIFQAIQTAAAPVVDVSTFVSPGVQTAIANPSAFFWISPVEPAYRVGALPDGIAVVVPQVWSEATSTVLSVVGDANGLSLSNETESAAAPVSLTFPPSDRQGARWLFSARERTAYMVGGETFGAPTGDVWSFDLSAGTWQHLFGPGGRLQARVLGNVLALSYDEPRGKLVVVDSLPPRTEGPAPISRIVVFDTHTISAKVAALLDVSSFSKVGLVARDDDTLVLVGTRGASGGWSAYQFALTATDSVSWLGTTTGSGLPIADPTLSEVGASLFVVSGQTPNVTDLRPGLFVGFGPPADLHVCDHAPTITPPPAVTLSTCSHPNIGTANASGCEGALRVTSNAPAVFPLGRTTVTWTAKDMIGHVVTAQQAVTTFLGDDRSCCPPGTNVIVGTPNNDVLVGTAGSDCILALGAQDNISGGGGDDFISGGDGDDVIDGGSGNDHIWGGSGQDQIIGGIGDDVIDGGDGDDTCHGGDGNDIIHGGNGQDHLFGENGNDQLFGDAGDDTLDGGPGNDALDGGGLHDVCIGGTGTNTFAMCQTRR